MNCYIYYKSHESYEAQIKAAFRFLQDSLVRAYPHLPQWVAQAQLQKQALPQKSLMTWMEVFPHIPTDMVQQFESILQQHLSPTLLSYVEGKRHVEYFENIDGQASSFCTEPEEKPHF